MADLRRKLRNISSAALYVICSASAAQDPATVDSPYVEPGDCWTYRAQGLQNREPIDAYEECVTFVDKAKNIIIAVARIEGGDREIDTSYTLDWGSIVGVDGLITPGGRSHFRFPMRAGGRYSIEFEYRLAVRGAWAGRSWYDIEVVGWEDVTVPAGTFRALRLEARGNTRRYDLGVTGPLRNTYWYAPTAQRWVKQEFVSKARQFRRELVKYKLNQ